MKKYTCYLGMTESQVYTLEAKNLKELRLELGKRWKTYVGKWYKQPVDGCPRGSKRFIIKGEAYGFKHKTPILIIPERRPQY